LAYNKLICTVFLLFIYIKQYNGKRVGFYCLFLSLFFRVYRARVVPENILKKQARDAKLAAAVKDRRAKAKADRVTTRAAAMKNAEKYFNEYQAADQALIKAKRDAKAAGNFFVPEQPKVAFVVRIRG
jgi:hypothetical protein